MALTVLFLTLHFLSTNLQCLLLEKEPLQCFLSHVINSDVNKYIGD